MRVQRASPKISTSGWSPLGPAPLASDASGIGIQDYNWVSGRATAVAIDPSDPTANTVYVGGAYGGLWKSTNATAATGSVIWTPLIDNQATLAVGAIAIQPGGTGVLLVGTGEADNSADSYYGLGILRSTNNGNSWTLISEDTTGSISFAGLAFSKIAFSTTTPTLVVAAAANTQDASIQGLVNPSSAPVGLYYSTDAGNSWTAATVEDGSTLTSTTSASTVAYNATAGLFFAALRYHGFYSSSDGIHWSRLANQPGLALTTANCPAQSNNTGCPIYRGELAVVPGRNEMYAWYVDANDNDQGIWTSTNGATSWSPINEAGITNCGDLQGCGTEQGTYNLELAAVPDGQATDLYAGAINLYKCQITSAVPDCSGTSPNTFLNLTHAYGCSSIARVHPAQHDLTFQLVNSNQQDVMYFANDGGIYRMLNGYNPSITGSCGGDPNPFDSLNQTLGSMTQFVSFSQASGDPNTILGGAQGNGSPATQSALTNPQWSNVDGGDGGYTQINPQNAEDWFVSNPSDSGVNIFRCESGIDCHTQNFEPVVTSETLGGDIGGYYSPYLLDPQNSSELVVGTCRISRGSSSGAGFSPLSVNFEDGGSGICTGQETNLVTTIAAGGPTDTNGFSNVIYAGTNGFGPFTPTIPSGGHVWVSTNVAGGTTTWVDQTGSINPNSYPISSIAIDPSDPTGLTAYLGIQGFGVSRVWQTQTGGASWNDFSANLPDAPINALLVDPGPNSSASTLYAATDVGVFSTFTGSPNWSEVGPAPNSGQSGYLPNVAVTALGMLNTGQDKFLRAATYGRGIWQFPLITAADFVISISNTPLTVFAGSNATFNGTLSALDGYNNSIQLSCVSGVTAPPSTCQLNPSNLTPTAAGASFQVNASGTDGTYNFNVQGVGNDSNHTTHTAAVTLNVVDFALTAPSPSSTTVAPGTTSSAIGFSVTAAGPFNQAVNLSCSGLPSGATCNFGPSASVTPTSTTPVAVSMTITTTTSATAGTFQISIQGSVTEGPTRSQNLSLTVTKDYAIAITNPSLTAYQNSNAVFSGTLTSLNGYSSPVNLTCGSGAPSTCTASPASVTPTAAGAAFTVTVSNKTCGQFSFNIVAAGTDSYATSHLAAVNFTSTSLASPDYVLEITNPSLTASVNTPAVFNGTLSTSSCYSSPVSVSCGSGGPPTCTPSPAALVPTATGAPFTITVASSKVSTYNFSISAQGTDPLSVQHAQIVTFTTTAATSGTFSFTNTSGPESVAPGQSASYSLSLAPASGTFPALVTMAVGNCPPLSTCTLSPTQVAAGAGSTAVQLNIQTAAPLVARLREHWMPLFAVFLPLPGMLLLSGSARKRNARFISLALLIFLLAALLACGGGLEGNSVAPSTPGTPAGSYTLTITASMNSAPGSPTKTADVTLVVQ